MSVETVMKTSISQADLERTRETKLLKAVKESGDKNAYSQLYSLMVPKLKGWLRGQGVEASESENIVHEVNTVKDILFLMFGVVISYEKIEAIMQYKKKEAAISIEDKYQEYDLRSQNSNFKFINNRIYLNEIDGNDIEYIKDKTKHISSLFDKNKH